MSWTAEEKLNALLRMPWTIVPEVTPEGDRLLRVKELPGAVGGGSDDEALEKDFWESLTETLRAYLHFGDPIPLPDGSDLPWEQPEKQQAIPVQFEDPRDGSDLPDPAATANAARIERDLIAA